MKTLLTEQQVQQGIRQLAEKIEARYQGRTLTLVGVMVGSVVLLADLIRMLKMPLRVNLIQSRGRDGEGRPGPLVIDPEVLAADCRGRHVVLVDDLFATGKTLWELVPQIDDLGPASVHTAVLLRKQRRAEVPMQPDFVAFEIPDVFVVGYGLDFHDQYRYLPYLAVLEPAELSGEASR